MEAQKTKIFFLNGISTSFLEKKQIYFDLNQKVLTCQNIITKEQGKIVNENQKQYSIYLNELSVDEDWLKQNENEDKHKGYIKMNLNFADTSKKFNNIENCEILINLEKNRINFIFGLEIGDLNKRYNYSHKKLDSYFISFNLNFNYFNKYIIENVENEFQADYLEYLIKDAKIFLEKIHEEKNLEFNFSIIFEIFVYSKDKNDDIAVLLEAIKNNNIIYNYYKKERINDFIKEVFSNFEKSDNAWPFNYIHGDIPEAGDESSEEDEEKEEEEEEEKRNKINNNKQKTQFSINEYEIHFISFFLGYFSQEKEVSDLDFDIFFMNDKIKNITIEALSKIEKNNNKISIICRKYFMKLCNKNEDILGKLQLETELIQYLKYINEKFNVLYELIKSAGVDNYTINEKLITRNINLEQIYPIFKEIILKEKEKNFFFLNFKEFMEKSIELFKYNDLNNLISLISFIDYERKFNKENEHKTEIVNLGFAINNAIKSNINLKNCLYFMDIIPKIGKYFNKFSDVLINLVMKINL